MKKLLGVVLALAMVLTMGATAFATQAENVTDESNDVAEYTTRDFPAEAYERLDIEIGSMDLSPVTRRSLTSGEFSYREYTVYEHGIAVSDTYIKTGLTRADASKKVTQIVTYRPSGANSSTYIQSSVTGMLYFNSANNTAYFEDAYGYIIQNTTSFEICDEVCTTSEGGGLFGSRRWAEAKFTYKWINNFGNKMSGGEARVRRNSDGAAA